MLFEKKKWFLAISRLTSIWKSGTFGKKMVHSNYYISSKSEHRIKKKCLPAIWKWKKLVPSYFDPDKHCCSYLEREKSGSLLFGD